MEKELSYEQLCKGSKVYEDSESITDRVPLQNSYEEKINSAFNQSGFQSSKK
jgi:hypothetical protein